MERLLIMATGVSSGTKNYVCQSRARDWADPNSGDCSNYWLRLDRDGSGHRTPGFDGARLALESVRLSMSLLVQHECK